MVRQIIILLAASVVLAGCQASNTKPAAEVTPTTEEAAPELISENTTPEIICTPVGWDEVLVDGPQAPNEKERFSTSTYDLVAYDYGETLSGKWAKRYRFDVMQNGCVRGILTVGSYDEITQLQRTSGRIGSSERIYHFDSYEVGKHEAFGMSRKEPTYALAKKFAIMAAQRFN